MLAIVLMAIFADYLAPADPTRSSMLRRLRPIGTPGYPLGADELGRDMLSRLIFGARLSLFMGVVPVFIAFIIGSVIGIAAGFERPPQEGETLWLIALFSASVGLPFFAVAANGPLLQAWFARSGHPRAIDPYFLYAASNVGSFLALLAYPFLIEPVLTLSQQSLAWSFGFGLLLAAIPGAGTLTELRDVLLTAETEIYGGASPRVVPFADIRDIGSLLQRSGFALPVIDEESFTVRYDHIFALMRDLKAMGMANPLIGRSRRPVSRRFFLRAAELYAERYADPDGRIRATFSIIFVSGWAPHESQQKPLKPGSAKMRLADALDPNRSVSPAKESEN